MNALVAEAQTWVGVPFRHQGRDRRGVDCAGLVIAVGRACGVLGSLPVAAGRYGRLPNPRHIGAILAAIGRLTEAPEPGDVLWFGHPRVPTHLGILADDGRVVHADGLVGRVIAHRLTEPVRAAFRYPGVPRG